MNRSVFLTASLFALLIIALLNRHGGILLLCAPLLFYLLAGWLTRPEAIQLDVDRWLSLERANPNDLVTMRITIRSRTLQPLTLWVEDHLPPGVQVHTGETQCLLHLAETPVSFEYIFSAERGTYHFETIKFEVLNGFGATPYVLEISTRAQLFIAPQIMRLRSVFIRPRRTRVYTGQIPARMGGAGTEFFGVRNYQPGDPPRSINWRASARHAGIFSNEYQQERAADVTLVLDARRQANEFLGQQTLFDHSVSAVATLADVLLAQGNRVGLAIQGNMLYWTYPAYGKLQRERLLRNLMGARPEENQSFAGLPRLPLGTLPPGAQIILFSPLITSPLMADDLEVVTQWRARGFQVLIIIPDPVSFELSLLASDDDVQLAGRITQLERRVMLRRLLHAGVRIIEWNVSQPFQQAVAPYLSQAQVGGMP